MSGTWQHKRRPLEDGEPREAHISHSGLLVKLGKVSDLFRTFGGNVAKYAWLDKVARLMLASPSVPAHESIALLVLLGEYAAARQVIVEDKLLDAALLAEFESATLQEGSLQAAISAIRGTLPISSEVSSQQLLALALAGGASAFARDLALPDLKE